MSAINFAQYQAMPALKPTKASAKRTKKYNAFNIFFMLERQLLLNERDAGINAIANPIDPASSSLTRPTKPLQLPPLCERYAHLPLTSNWFLELTANSGKKRCHRRTHGKISFKELASTIAKNYRSIDTVTKAFVDEVTELLASHMKELEVIEQQEKFAALQARTAAGLPLQKRKDAPVVSSAAMKRAKMQEQAFLSQDEAMIANQLPPMAHYLPFPAATHSTGLFSHPRPPSQNYYPSSSSGSRSEQLNIEMERAIQDRIESERRIQALNDRLSIQHQQQQQQCPQSSSSMYHQTSLPPPQVGYPFTIAPSQPMRAILPPGGFDNSRSTFPLHHGSTPSPVPTTTTNAAQQLPLRVMHDPKSLKRNC